VLLTPHLGCFEICAQAYAERFGRASPSPCCTARRARPGCASWKKPPAPAPAGHRPASLAGVRQMMRALRKGETVGLLPDQVPPDGMGVWAPFFGQPAYTMTWPPLVLQTGAPGC
jgi:KDO2-lipid IV(A) lauroyltransferase